MAAAVAGVGSIQKAGDRPFLRVLGGLGIGGGYGRGFGVCVVVFGVAVA